MKENVLNNRELAQIKRIAQNVDTDFQKVCKLEAQINKLTQERDSLQQGIDETEAPVIRKTGGYRSTDIYKKEVIPQFNADGTPKVDKNGRQLKVTKYVLRYPDTLVPPCETDASIEVNETPTEEERTETPNPSIL